MKTLLERDPDIKKAHGVQSRRLCHHRARPNRPHARTNVYQEFSGNSKYREVYEARLKWQKDYEGRLNYEQKKAREEGRQEGLEKGMEKGRKEEKIATAIELLKLNMSIEVTSKATGLSHEAVEKLKTEI